MVKTLNAKACALLQAGWLAMAWLGSAILKPRRRVLAAVVAVLTLAPGLALASPGCDAINAGAFNQATTYNAGVVQSTNARETIGSTTYNGIVTNNWTGATTATRFYNGGSPYAFTPGEVITVNATVNATSGVLRAALFRGGSSTTIGITINSLTTSGSFSYTVVSPEYAFDARLLQSTSGTGTVSMTATCTPAAPSITSLSVTQGPTSGGTSVTLTGTNLSSGTLTVDGAGVTPSALTDTSATFTTPAHAAGAVAVAITTPGGTATTSFTYVAAPTVTAVAPGSGPAGGGGTVVITGTGFAAANPTGAVRFGATTATYTINSNTQITATAPANSAGTYDVTVTTPGGTSATSAADQYTYVAAPTVTSVSPTAGPTTGGATVTITGTGFAYAPGTGAVKFGASNATYIINSNTQITATAPANAAGTYDVTVTTPGGTSATSAADQYTYVAAPTVTSLSPTSIPTTGGTTVTITGTGFASTSAVTFGATAASGFTVTSATQITATAPAGSAGTVNVRVTNAGGTSATGAANQLTYVTPGTVSITGIPATLAAGQTVTATVTPSMAPPTGSLTVSLALSGPAGLTTSTNSLVFTNASPQTFTVTAAAPLGTKTLTWSLSGGASGFYGTPSATDVTVTAAAPTISSFTYGSIVAYNAGSNQTTSIDLALGGNVQNNPTSYAVGSATTAQGGSVSVDSSGQATYTPPVGFRGNDSFSWTATNGSGTSAPATVTVAIGNPSLSALLTGSGTRGAALAGVLVSVDGGRAPYSCGVVPASGALPAGVSINADCAVTGTPTASGTFNFTVNVTDSSLGTGPYTQASGALTLVVAAPTLTLSPAAGALPGATAGAAYAQTFTAGAGTAPYSYSLTGGALPPGLTLSGATVSGTPTATGTFNFTLTATDSASAGSGGPYTVSRSYAITVAAPTISLSPSALPSGAVAAAYSQTISAGGGTSTYAYAVTAGALPDGLSLDGASGVISGTPTRDGAFTFTITATDSTTGAGAPYSGSRAYSLSIAAPTITLSPASLPNAAIGAAYSRTLGASGGTGTYTYAVTSGSLAPGLTLSSSGVIAGTPTGAGAWNFTVTATDGALTRYSGSAAYTLTVSAPVIAVTPTTVPGATVGAAYSQTLSAGGGTAGYTYAVTAGSLPAGLTLSNAGVLSGTPTAGGTFNFTITATDSSTGTGAPFSGARAYAMSVAAPTVVIAPTTLPNWIAGTAYSQTVTATGGTGPYSFAVTAGALPPGWTLSPAGVLSGTATASNQFNFTITATDSSTGVGAPYSASRAYTVNVGSPIFTLTPPTLSARVGQAYSGAFVAGGGTAPYTYSRHAGTLPPGLTLAADGTLSGTPTAGGTYNFTLIARDSTTGPGGPYAVASNYNFTVTAPTLSLSPSSLADGLVGVAYSGAVSAGGGTAPYSYAVTAGALPPGVTLNPGTGALAGTPSTTGTFNFTLTATDSSTGSGAPFSVSTAYGITVNPGAQILTFGALADASLSSSPLTLSASATSTLTVSFVSETPAVCTVSGATLTLVQTGTCTIRAEQAGDANWAAATAVSRSFTVTPAILAITPGAASGLQVGASYSQANLAAGGVAPYTYSLGAGAFVPGTTINATTGEVSGRPTVAGSFSYIVRATDAQPVSVDTPVTTVVIARGDQTIAFTSTAPSAVVGGPAYGVTASATSGLGVVFTLDAASTGCALSGSTVTFTAPGTCVINADQAGNANWNPATRVQQSFTVIANPPVAANVSGVTVPYNSPGTAIDLSAALSGGAHTAIAVVAAPAHGTVSVAGDVVTYAPAAGYYGADSFTYTATGPGGTSNVATVSLTVGTPPAPTVSNVSNVAVGYNAAGVAIDLSGSVSGVRSGLVIATAPAHGAVTVSGEVVTYTPTTGYYGPDSFTYAATGPGGTSAAATVSVVVANPPPPVVTPPTTPVVLPPSPAGPPQPVTVNLGAVSGGVIDGFRITANAQHGSATITVAAALAQASGSGPQAAPGDYQLSYTPAANFMGTDTVAVVAYGPGGDSAPVTFTFQVAGKAPDLSGATPSNGAITFSPTTTLVGGPFQGLRITRAPAFGTATVSGLTLVFTPGVANGGSTSLDYVIDLPFGASAAGRIDLTSNIVPGAQALTANTVQGDPVTVRISNTVGGPFTGAAVVSISPTPAGTATLAGSGGVYDLTFTPAGTFSGAATVTFSLTNAFGTTNGTLVVTVEARPDPGLDPEVRGVATSQVTSARRFADTQIGNFQRRLRDLHDGTNDSGNGVSLNVGFGAQGDADNDPRVALRRQLSNGRDRIDPDSLGVDREREMLGLDLWAGRRAEGDDAIAPGVNGLSTGQPSGAERRSPLGFWTAGSVDWGRQDAQGQRDYRFTTQGVTAGVDMRLNDTLIVGVGLGYGEDRTKIGDEGSVSNGSGFTGAVYASWRPAEAFYIDGVVGVSNLEFDSRRWTTGIGGDPDAYAEGERSGDSRFLSAAFGRILKGEAVTSEVYARLDARSIALDGFTETGAGLSSLIWDPVDQDSVSANLGASWRWLVEDRRYGLIRPSARIEWSHEFEDVGDQGVRYADWAASPTYLVPLDAWSRDTIRLDLGVDWSLSERMALGLGYRGAFGDAGASHGGEVRLKFGW